MAQRKTLTAGDTNAAGAALVLVGVTLLTM